MTKHRSVVSPRLVGVLPLPLQQQHVLPLLMILVVVVVGGVVEGRFSIVPCNGPCIESFDESCETVISLYDFSGNCCALSDSPSISSANDNDNDEGSKSSGGCTLTVGVATTTTTADDDYGNAGEAACARVSRIGMDCTMPAKEPLVPICVGGGFVIYEPTTARDGSSSATIDDDDDVDCPASEYTLYNESFIGTLFSQSMTLTGRGLSPLTYQDALEWQQVTAHHTAMYFDDHPELGIHDVVTYLLVYMEQDGTITATGSDDATDNADQQDLMITYFQHFGWRSDIGIMDVSTLVDEAFRSEFGRIAYLERLQATTTFAAITDVAELEGTTMPPTPEWTTTTGIPIHSTGMTPPPTTASTTTATAEDEYDEDEYDLAPDGKPGFDKPAVITSTSSAGTSSTSDATGTTTSDTASTTTSDAGSTGTSGTASDAPTDAELSTTTTTTTVVGDSPVSSTAGDDTTASSSVVDETVAPASIRADDTISETSRAATISITTTSGTGSMNGGGDGYYASSLMMMMRIILPVAVGFAF